MTKPSAHRRRLYLIAGLLWTIAGSILVERAYGWLDDLDTSQLIVVLSLSSLLGLIFFFAGFIKIVRKNINRIKSLPDKVSVFAFTAWKGYVIIAVMVSAGIMLRSSSFPKHYLAVFYLAMGFSLLMGSFLFYHNYFSKATKRK